MHFSIAHSMRSNLKMASRRVRSIADEPRALLRPVRTRLGPLGDGDDPPAADAVAGGDIEFLAYAGAQDADQMISVIAGEGGVGCLRLHRRSIGGGSWDEQRTCSSG